PLSGRLERLAAVEIRRPDAIRRSAPLQRQRRRLQLVFGDLAQRSDEREPFVVVARRLEQHFVGAAEARPVGLLAVDREQLAGDLEVVRLDRERALERLEGPLGLTQSILAERGDTAIERHALLDVADAVGG